MQEIGSFLYFMILYLLLMVFLPAKVLKFPMGRKQIADSTVKALLVSYTVCISWVYALGLLHLYNRYTLVMGLLLTLFVYGLVRKVKYRKMIMDTIRVMALLGGGQYRAEIFIKDWLRKTGKSLKESMKNFLKDLTFGKIVFFFASLAMIVILMQRRLPAFFDTYAYRTSDMYVHNEWINYMEAGDLFYDGIYPFGMHNILSALHLLSGLHINQIFRYYGAFNSFFVVAMAVYFLCRVTRSKAAVLIYLALYGVTNFAGNEFAFRMGFTLPQECGMPFLLVCVLFLGKFLENRKREDGIYFALASALTLSMHFFTVIFAIALCGSLALVYLGRIWKEKMILPLCRCVLLIACISILPFMGGMLEGKQWQGSMQWALGVMTADSAEDATEDGIEPEAETDTETASSAPENSGRQEKRVSVAVKLKDGVVSFWNLMTEGMYAFWGYVFWAGIFYAVIYFLLERRFWSDWRGRQLFAVWLTLVFCVVLLGYRIIGMPQLMKENRVRMFIGYLGPMLFALPFETLAGCSWKWGKRVCEGMGLVAAALCCYVTYGLGNLPFQSYYHLETSTAAQACVRIAGECEKDTWTVVSPVDELPLIRGQGYHYELWQFIADMERYEPDRYLEIPTRYVFFVLEKKPFVYNSIRIIGQEYDDAPIDLADADTVVTKEMLGISRWGSMKYYNLYENRRALEAKLAAWISVYSEMFPEQMEVYMDSDDCIIYRLEQNVYAYNNLAVDYGYNVISDEAYQQMLIQKQKEREEMSREQQESGNL